MTTFGKWAITGAAAIGVLALGQLYKPDTEPRVPGRPAQIEHEAQIRPLPGGGTVTVHADGTTSVTLPDDTAVVPPPDPDRSLRDEIMLFAVAPCQVDALMLEGLSFPDAVAAQPVLAERNKPQVEAVIAAALPLVRHLSTFAERDIVYGFVYSECSLGLG